MCAARSQACPFRARGRACIAPPRARQGEPSRAGVTSWRVQGTVCSDVSQPDSNGAAGAGARSIGGAASNGPPRHQAEKVRAAIIGVGNCASAFVQGVHYYHDANPAERVPGLMHVDLGGYHVRDIEFTAAFDIDGEKVGKDLGQAIWAGQNNTIAFAKVPKHLGVSVQRGMTHDGLGKYLSQKITKAPGETADIVRILKDTRTDVVIS